MESQNGQDVEDAQWRKFWAEAAVIGSSVRRRRGGTLASMITLKRETKSDRGRTLSLISSLCAVYQVIARYSFSKYLLCFVLSAWRYSGTSTGNIMVSLILSLPSQRE